MKYTCGEEDIIVADGFTELNYKQKKLFLAAQKPDNPQRDKYADALIKICGAGVYNKLKEKFGDPSYRERAIGALERAHVSCVTVKSDGYPELLKNIPVPPLALYLKGNAELLRGEAFAVVGSRKTGAAYIAECKKICAELTSHFTVVTGVADGADCAAARGALESGKVICVLPGGHNRSGAANPRLLEEVEKRGLSVSECPPDTPAQRYTFVLRNRVMAGLVKGVLVVSAGEKSGALSTASYALEYGREVFALPYAPGVISGKGCNNLIKSGAALCESAEDIFKAFGYHNEEKTQPQLDGDERAALDIIKQNGEMHAGALAAALGKKPYEVAIVCSSLEIKGLIVKLGGNRYAAV